MLFDKSLKNDPANVEKLYNKAKSLQETSQYDEANVVFDSIISIDKDNVDALYGKAKTVLLQGKILDSLNMLQKVIDRDPIYKEIIRKDKEFERLQGNQLFSDIIKPKKEFDAIDDHKVFKKITQ